MVDKNTHGPIFEFYSLISALSKSVKYCRVRLRGYKKSWNNTETCLNAFYWEIRWRHRQWNESHQGLPNSMKVPSTVRWEFSAIYTYATHALQVWFKYISLFPLFITHTLNFKINFDSLCRMLFKADNWTL